MKRNRLFKKLSEQCELESFTYFFDYEQHKRFFSKKAVEERKERYKKLFNGKN